MSSFLMIFSRFGEMMSRPGSVMMGGMPAIGRPCLLIRDSAKKMHCFPRNVKILLVIHFPVDHASDDYIFNTVCPLAKQNNNCLSWFSLISY